MLVVVIRSHLPRCRKMQDIVCKAAALCQITGEHALYCAGRKMACLGANLGHGWPASTKIAEASMGTAAGVMWMNSTYTPPAYAGGCTF